MRIDPRYLSKHQLDYQQNFGYDPKRPIIKPYPKGELPKIKFGDPSKLLEQKKHLIKELVIDPEKREEAIKAAQLEQKAGVKDKPITEALIKTTAAHESAMSAASAQESEAIAEATAEAVVKQERKITIKKLVSNSLFTLVVGVILTIAAFKYLIKD